MNDRNEEDDSGRAGWSSSLRDLFFNILFSPIRLSIILLTHGLSAIRPFSPQLIPIIVCILLIPVILLLSAYAGWAVWSSAAVSWQADLNVQYGYAFLVLSRVEAERSQGWGPTLCICPYLWTHSSTAL